MPQGLANSPATFQRAMDEIALEEAERSSQPLANINRPYLDDKFLGSMTFEQHLKDLAVIF